MKGADIALKAIELNMPLTVPSINRILKQQSSENLEQLIEVEHSKSLTSIRNMLIPNGIYQGEVDADPYVQNVLSGTRPLAVGENDPKLVAVLNLNQSNAYEIAMYITRKYIKGEIIYLPRIALTILKRYVATTEG